MTYKIQVIGRYKICYRPLYHKLQNLPLIDNYILLYFISDVWSDIQPTVDPSTPVGPGGPADEFMLAIC